MQAYSSATDIIRACWIVFITIWLVAAVSTKRAVYRESRAQRLRYWVLFVIACLLLFYGRELPYPLNLRIIPHAIPIACAAAFFAPQVWLSRSGPEYAPDLTGSALPTLQRDQQ